MIEVGEHMTVTRSIDVVLAHEQAKRAQTVEPSDDDLRAAEIELDEVQVVDSMPPTADTLETLSLEELRAQLADANEQHAANEHTRRRLAEQRPDASLRVFIHRHDAEAIDNLAHIDDEIEQCGRRRNNLQEIIRELEQRIAAAVKAIQADEAGNAERAQQHAYLDQLNIERNALGEIDQLLYALGQKCIALEPILRLTDEHRKRNGVPSRRAFLEGCIQQTALREFRQRGAELIGGLLVGNSPSAVGITVQPLWTYDDPEIAALEHEKEYLT